MNPQIHIEAYETHSPAHRKLWDDFVRKSRNGTFLFMRDYMDYHNDRFEDCSLIVKKNNTPVALLPATLHDGTEVRSHGGLTYGGLIMPFSGKLDATLTINVMEEIACHYRARGIERLVYSPVPHIYHAYPSEEDIYALWRMGARIYECKISSVISLASPMPFNERSRRNLSKAAKTELTISEDPAYMPVFWKELQEVLHRKHNAEPVHTLSEMEKLRASFPDNIRLFCALDPEGELYAGMILYLCGPCAHAQYIASTEKGHANGAIAAIVSHLVESGINGARFFDLGTSNEDHGRYLNAGLIEQKYGFGARGVAYPTYILDL